MRVLFIVNSLRVGGAEKMVCHLARRYHELGLHAEVGCLDDMGTLGQQLCESGIPVAVYGRKPGFDVGLPLRMARHIRRQRFDVVHAHQSTGYVYGVLAKLFVPRPFVFTEHGRHYPDLPSWKRQCFNRALQYLVNRTTAVSAEVRDALVNVEKFSRQRIGVIQNGIEVSECERFVEADKADLRRQVGLPTDRRILGTVSRLDPIKNQRLLIHAVARLRKECPEALLVFVGEGSERSRLERCSRDLNVEEHVVFLGMRQDVARLLPCFDVFVLTSLNEGVPMSVLEAIAARVPIVSTAVGGIPDLLADERGVLVRMEPVDSFASDDPMPKAWVESYATSLTTLLADPVRVDRITGNAVEYIRQRFSVESIAKQYLQLYEQLVPRSVPTHV